MAWNAASRRSRTLRQRSLKSRERVDRLVELACSAAVHSSQLAQIDVRSHLYRGRNRVAGREGARLGSECVEGGIQTIASETQTSRAVKNSFVAGSRRETVRGAAQRLGQRRRQRHRLADGRLDDLPEFRRMGRRQEHAAAPRSADERLAADRARRSLRADRADTRSAGRRAPISATTVASSKAAPSMSLRSASRSSPYIARIRSKLLGAPTSMALATVLTDARGW